MAQMLRKMFRTCVGVTRVAVLVAVQSAAAWAQAGPGQQPSQPDRSLRFVVPPVTVTAHKEPEDKQRLPVSVTAVTLDTIEKAGLQIVSDAALFAPNVFFSEFTARKVSNARVRGIGSSPNNPAITTYIDGVPQIHGNASSVDLLDVERIEFVRGPQGALFGRNTLGGLVNVVTRRPSLDAWSGTFAVPVGSQGSWSVRGGASGPIVADRLGASVSFAQVVRDGFTVNDLTGHTIDDRSGFSGKGQLLWTPASPWEARLIVFGERARDGDYALNDLDGLRARPFHVSRDFEGFQDRDVFSTAIHTHRSGSSIAFSTITGFVRWTTQDVTDLDYTPLPLVTRDNSERDFQFTQEVRLASAEKQPLSLGAAALRWQAGVLAFSRAYEQDAVNAFAPFLLSPQLALPVSEHSPLSRLEDAGVGVFGQGTLTIAERFDLIPGVRVDYERKTARLETFYEPQIAPPTLVNAEDSFANVSPQFAAAYRFRPEHSAYATVGRGFKAGGFNAASPSGREAYDQERAWHVEAGLKTAWAGGRLTANAAVFHIDWADLQLNLPNPVVPGQFYIDNAGDATSMGIELEATARPVQGWDLFTAIGYTRARFAEGSTSGGVAVGSNRISFTPGYTASGGVQYSRAITTASSVYGRADVVFYGSFFHDDANTQSQEAYSLANLRGGIRGRYLFGEAWIRNAFDTRYTTIVIAYEPFAPSGFVGELGAPRTFGVSGGVRF
jgi:iron complex outermembrane receptor protein